MSVLMFWLHTRNIRVYSCCICSKKNNNTLCITRTDKYKYTNLLSQNTFLIICQLQRWPSLPPCHLLFLVSNNLWTWFRIETIIVTMLSFYPCLVTRVTLSLIVAQASHTQPLCHPSDYPQDCPLGNPEYISHQDCSSQLLCFFLHCLQLMWPLGEYRGPRLSSYSITIIQKKKIMLYFYHILIFFWKGLVVPSLFNHYHKYRE